MEASADLRSAQDTVWIRAPRAVHSSFGGGVSILNLGTGQYFRLDGVGAHIWNILAQPVTIDAIAGMIVADYAIEAATAEATVATFVDSMRRAGLVAAS